MWDYSEKVKEYFFNPKNSGSLDTADGTGDVGAIACGDALRLQIKVNPETEVITDARFQTFGCGSAIASSSALTEIIIGKTIDEALKITNQDIADFLGGLPPEKMHCSVMGYEALRAAVANYRGEVWEDDHEEGALLCKCFGVDEGMVERAVRMNTLTSLEQVTHFTKAMGSCATCVERVEEVLARVNAQMVQEGALSVDQAFDPESSVIPRPKAKNGNGKSATIQLTPPAASETNAVAAAADTLPKLNTLQRIRLIEQSIEEMRPTFRRDGGDCELVDVEEDRIFVKFSGACVGCQLEAMTLQGVQQVLMERLGRPLRVIPVGAQSHTH